MRSISKHKKAWLIVLLYTVFLYSTLYIMRPICSFLEKHTPFKLLVNIVVLICVGVLLYIFYTLVHPKKMSLYLLVILGLLVGFFSFRLIERPEEKMHFLEYGLLGFLVYRASSFNFRGLVLLIFSLFLVLLLGFVDEVIQYFLPNRFYDKRDILLNWLASGLGLYFTRLFKRGEYNRRR